MIYPAGNGMVCPLCGSGQVQSVRAIYEGGTSTTRGRGVAVGGYGDLADGDGFEGSVMGVSRSTQVSQSVLAGRCAPPREEDFRVVGSHTGRAMALFGGGLLAGAGGWGLLDVHGLAGMALVAAGFALIVAGAVTITKRDKVQESARRYYARAMADWGRRCYCHSCGQMGEPVARP